VASRHLIQSKSDLTLGLLGCGPINFEIARFELAVHPQIARIAAYDVIPERANRFKEKCLDEFDKVRIDVVSDIRDLLSISTHVSLATTAIKPHIHNLSSMAPGSTILNVSLRDLTPELILSCDNIVDDVGHVCRAQTSLHLAEQLTGNRDFIRCTLADILMGKASARRDRDSIAVFSPFGLGILDLAVGQFAHNLALGQKCGMSISSFLPAPWNVIYGDESVTPTSI
jgi:ornithine cyclodeaminase